VSGTPLDGLIDGYTGRPAVISRASRVVPVLAGGRGAGNTATSELCSAGRKGTHRCPRPWERTHRQTYGKTDGSEPEEGPPAPPGREASRMLRGLTLRMKKFSSFFNVLKIFVKIFVHNEIY